MKKVLTIMDASCLFLLLNVAALGKNSSQNIVVKAPASKVWADDNPAVQKSSLISGDGESVGSVIQYYPAAGKFNPVKIKATVIASEKYKKLEYNGAV